MEQITISHGTNHHFSWKKNPMLPCIHSVQASVGGFQPCHTRRSRVAHKSTVGSGLLLCSWSLRLKSLGELCHLVGGLMVIFHGIFHGIYILTQMYISGWWWLVAINLAFSQKYWEFMSWSQLTKSIIFQRGSSPGPPTSHWLIFYAQKGLIYVTGTSHCQKYVVGPPWSQDWACKVQQATSSVPCRFWDIPSGKHGKHGKKKHGKPVFFMGRLTNQVATFVHSWSLSSVMKSADPMARLPDLWKIYLKYLEISPRSPDFSRSIFEV